MSGLSKGPLLSVQVRSGQVLVKEIVHVRSGQVISCQFRVIFRYLSNRRTDKTDNNCDLVICTIAILGRISYMYRMIYEVVWCWIVYISEKRIKASWPLVGLGIRSDQIRSGQRVQKIGSSHSKVRSGQVMTWPIDKPEVYSQYAA